MGAKWRKHEASKLATAICCQTLSSVSFLSWFFGAMKGFNFSRFGKVHRQQHQEELAAQQAVMYMHQHLGSSRSGRFFHTPNHQKPQPNHWVTPSFLMCSLRCLSTYIPSMLWLHMCYSRIIHPKPEHFCLPFFLGGGLFKVNPWTCRGTQITWRNWSFG